MKTKLNEEILNMTLNADNRARFIDAILKDAFQKRSDAIRDRFGALLPKLFRRTFGATPQAQAANIKAIAKHRAEVEIADAIIRLLDLAAVKGYDIGGALVEKCEYNITRADHSIAERKKDGGKKV